MNTEQIRLVQESFRKVVPIADAAAALFYGRLFDLDPSLESLFKGDIVGQGRKLMQMIGVAVKGLDRIGQVLPALCALGARHAGYGVREKDYDTVGRALIWTLRKGLGDDFTPEAEAAWVAVYAALAGVMKSAQAEAAQTRAYVLAR
ncbi:MAG TPA: globin family protein [Pyrinomonadaceae bacterium]|jgi:hemoglobin-like flavoprotein